MAFDITKKRAIETAQIELITGDNGPLLDDDGNRLCVTVYGPGSKKWNQANAEKSRKRTARMEKNRKMSAALEGAQEDEIDFLVAVTISFDGWEYPCPDKEWPSKQDMFRAAYEDDALGFIRDHVFAEVNSWEAFTKG